MQDEAATGKELIGPATEPEPQETKVRIEFLGEDRAAEPAPELPPVDLKTAIAERVRSDGRERGMLTAEESVVDLVPGMRHEAVSAALAEMVKDPGYGDIKAVTTASGLVFFYSERHIKLAEAAAKSLLEEVKFRIAERVRGESREAELLTPVDALYAEIGWDKAAYDPDEVRKDPRYEDIKTIRAATGEQFFYSTRHLSDYYALLLSRVAAHDPCALIAETVRDESRIYPRPTCVLLFRQKLFGLDEADLKAIVDLTLEKAEFGDLRKMVHPVTGGVYLYSAQYMTEDLAWGMMDWEEVGRDANP